MIIIIVIIMNESMRYAADFYLVYTHTYTSNL